MARHHDPRAALVVGLCVYEAGAILTGKVPTITSIAWRIRGTFPGRVVIWGALGVLAYHLMVEQDVVGQAAEALSHG
jgi:hypothetical protein